jgi:hypothetical protein
MVMVMVIALDLLSAWLRAASPGELFARSSRARGAVRGEDRG